MMEIDPTIIAQADCAYWAELNKIQLQTCTFSFEDHGYQLEPLQSTARRLCYMKATQGGFTELEVLKSLHGMIFRRYPKGVLYLFPTTDNVGEFSKSRFNPLIQANRDSIGKYVKSGGRGTDTTSLKKIHDAFLYLRGARLSQKIGSGDDAKESTQLRSIPVDRVVFDEVDLMDEEIITKARMRMGASKIKEEAFISNPTLPDYGIDKIFQKSDQRHLFRKCTCNHWTCAELSFPECVKTKNGIGYIGCDKCGKEVGISNPDMIEWVPSKRENTDFMHGYRWSQLSSVFNDPYEILTDFNDPPQGNIGDVYRLRLGLPYVAAEDKLTHDAVFKCCGPDIQQTFSKGPCAMGVDVGKIKHVVIGARTGMDNYEILKVIQLSDWNDIHDIAKRFNVKSAVIDIRPYEDAARTFQAAEPYKIFLCEYSETSTIGTSYNNNTGIVKVNRTEIFDTTHRMIMKQQVVLPRRCKEIDEFAKQMCNCAKVLETNKRSGTKIYRYRSLGSGGDHYRNAMNYFSLAASGARIASVSTVPRQEYAISEYKIM